MKAPLEFICFILIVFSSMTINNNELLYNLITFILYSVWLIMNIKLHMYSQAFFMLIMIFFTIKNLIDILIDNGKGAENE